MSYRRLSDTELQAVLLEQQAFQTWQHYARYALDIYGSKAERIDVSTNTDYNDEWTYLVTEYVDVHSADGQSLELDLTTDWWITMAQEQLGMGPEELAEWRADIVGERRARLPVITDGYDTFFVSKPPPRTYRAFYVRDEA